MYKKNDTLCKSVLEDFFKEFLQFTFKDIGKVFDLQRPFDFLNKELAEISKGYTDVKHPQFVDMLAKVYFKDSDKFALFHVEVQGYRQKLFPARMHNYFIRLRDKYKANICSYVIFTDPHHNFRPDFYEYNYLTTSSTFKFEAYKIKDQDDELLKKEINPFALIVRIMLLSLKRVHLTEEQVLSQKIELAKEILSRQLNEYQQNSLLKFLTRYINFEDGEMNTRFEKTIKQITDKKDTMGVAEMIKVIDYEEGVEYGAKITQRANVERMLKHGLTINAIRTFTGLSKKTIQTIRKQVFSPESQS